MTIEYYDGTKDSTQNTSGWVCRMRSRFTDSKGGVWVVEIIDQVTDTTGGWSWPTSTPEPFQLGPDGFTWKMDGKSDTFQVGAISTEVTFDIMVTETRHDQILSVIKGADDMRLGVAIYSVNGQVASGSGYVRPFWFGLISTEDMSWGPYTHPDSIRVRAHCGLSLLNDLEYVDGSGNPFTDTQNIGKHLQRLFSKIPTYSLWGWKANGTFTTQTGTSDFGEGLLTMYQWIADKDKHLFGGSDTLEKSVIGFTQCDSDSFNEVERTEDIFGGNYVTTETISCSEVLKNILSVFQVRMFQYGGTFLAHCPWQTGETTYVGRYQYSKLNDTVFTCTEDTVTETELHSNGFEMAAGVRDSFLFPVRQSKSTHKKGGARTIFQRSGYGIRVTADDGNVYDPILFTPEQLNSSFATVEPGTSLSLVGNFRIWALGYGSSGQNYNVDTGMIGCKPVIQLKIKVGNLYLKRNLQMSSQGYNIHRTAAPDLTYKPMVQVGDVEWTTTESTYDFQMPFPGCNEEPPIYNDTVVGGLHLELGSNDPFKFNSGFLSNGTQTQQVEADIAWNLPALPEQATDYIGVQFKATMKYMFRDGNNTLNIGPESNGGLPGLISYSPGHISGLRLFSSAHDDPDADVVFTSANDTNYTSEMGCVSILGDRYTDQNLGVLFLGDVNTPSNALEASNQNWVTYGDTSANGRPIHQLISRENLFMREETMRTRKVTFVGKVETDHKGFNRVTGSHNSSLVGLFPPTRLVNIIDAATSLERKWYVMNMAFTAASQVYDCELIMVDQAGGSTDPVHEDDTRPGETNGGNTGGDSTNPSGGGVLPVGLKGDTGTVVTTSGDVSLIQSKTDLLTITGATNLDTMRTDVNNNNSKVGVSTDQANKLGAISYTNNAISGFNFGSNTSVIHAEAIETDQDFQFVSQQLKLTIGTDATARLVTDLVTTTGAGASRKITGITTTSGELDVDNAREVEQLITVQSIQGSKFITGIQAGGGSVMSADQVEESSTRKYTTSDNLDKLGFISKDSDGITQFTTTGAGGTAVNLYHIHNTLLPSNGTCTNTGVYTSTCSAVKSAGRLPDPDQDRSGQTGEKIITVDASGDYQEIAQGTAGQVLQERGNGVFQFTSLTFPVASVSARVTASYTSNFYYGNSSYGWNYPIWSNISFNNATGNPYARRINDDYAHCGIVSAMKFRSFKVYGTIRNDSSTDNVKVALFKHARPNGSTSTMTVTEVASQDITVSTQDAHNNVEFTSTVGCEAGELLFIGIARTAGSTGTRYLNFSISIQGTV